MGKALVNIGYNFHNGSPEYVTGAEIPESEPRLAGWVERGIAKDDALLAAELTAEAEALEARSAGLAASAAAAREQAALDALARQQREAAEAAKLAEAKLEAAAVAKLDADAKAAAVKPSGKDKNTAKDAPSTDADAPAL